MSLQSFNKDHWLRKYTETGGYLFFRETFSSGDLINARLRYGRETDSWLARKIRKEVRGMLSKRELWTGIAAPLEAFYSGDWKDYTARGDELYEAYLVQFLGNDYFTDYLTEEELDNAKREATSILKDRGYFPETPTRHRTSPLRFSEDTLKELYEPPPDPPEDWDNFG